MKISNAIFIVFALSFINGCNENETPSDSKVISSNSINSSSEKVDSYNVVLISLDTTRADRLGCYGYEKAQTPNIDTLAQNGVKFTNAYSQVPLTLPAHAVMLTGSYPAQTGIHVNGTTKLSTKSKTLASSLKEKGYQTGGVVSAWVLNSLFGIDRGFDYYNDSLGYKKGEANVERSAEKTTDAAIRWLDTIDKTQPFFLLVHYFDPHDPYEPPEPFKSNLEDPYDGEIAYVDKQIGKILHWLESKKLTEKTLIVVTADHGEAFGEHNEIRHGLLVYNPTMKIPLIFSLKDVVPTGLSIRKNVSLVDIVPTISYFANIKKSQNMFGHNLVSNWLPGSSPASELVFMESEYGYRSYKWSPLYSVIADNYKYILSTSPELYNLKTDPEELDNVIDKDQSNAQQLRKILDEFLMNMSENESESVSGNPALASLGYSGNNYEDSDMTEDKLPDPKSMIVLYNKVQKAAGYNNIGQFQKTIELLAPEYENDDQSIELNQLLAKAYMNTGNLPASKNCYQNCLSVQDSNPVCMQGLIDILMFTGQFDQAEVLIDKAILLHQNNPEFYSRKGQLLTRKREFEKAHSSFLKQLSFAPDSPNALCNVGNTSWATGKQDDAIRYFNHALEIDKQCIVAYRSLFRLYVSRKEAGKATAILEAGLREMPNEPALLQLRN